MYETVEITLDSRGKQCFWEAALDDLSDASHCAEDERAEVDRPVVQINDHRDRRSGDTIGKNAKRCIHVVVVLSKVYKNPSCQLHILRQSEILPKALKSRRRQAGSTIERQEQEQRYN